MNHNGLGFQAYQTNRIDRVPSGMGSLESKTAIETWVAQFNNFWSGTNVTADNLDTLRQYGSRLTKLPDEDFSASRKQAIITKIQSYSDLLSKINAGTVPANTRPVPTVMKTAPTVIYNYNPVTGQTEAQKIVSVPSTATEKKIHIMDGLDIPESYLYYGAAALAIIFLMRGQK